MDIQRIRLVVAVVVVFGSALFATGAEADQYMCKERTVDRDARSAAPSHTSVKVVADESARTCHFHISGEVVDTTVSASTTGGGGSSSGSSTASANAREASSIANGQVLAIRQGSFQLPNDGAQAADALAPLLFGTRQAPSELRSLMQQRFGGAGELSRCLSSRSFSRGEMVRLGSGSNVLTCGGTGANGRFQAGSIVAEITVPKIYLHLQIGSRHTALFVPVQ
jgi:hypothetical protein